MNLALCLFLILPTSFSFSKADFQPEKHPNWKLLPPQNECGLNYVSGSRIVNGYVTNLGQIPWIALIGYYEIAAGKSSIKYYCGGSLISKNFVLTAAHCVPPNADGRIDHVRFGEYYTSTNIDCTSRPNKEKPLCAPPVQDIQVTKYFYHPNYNDWLDTLNDIALLKLKQSPVLNIAVQPICLPYGKAITQNFEESTALVAGWGYTETNIKSEILLAVDQKISNGTYCQNAYKKYTHRNVIDLKIHLCALGVNGEDSASGDSGGPLIWEGSFDHNIAKRAYLIGIVSFGPKHKTSKFSDVPRVYTRVTHYMQWILDNIDQ